MTIAPTGQKSRFIVNYRLKPEKSFSDLEYQFSTAGGYRLTFNGDIVAVEFDAHSKDRLNAMNKASEMLRDLLAILTFQIKHPLEFDLLSYIEDRPRDTVDARSYGLGRQKEYPEPPEVTATHIKHGASITRVAHHSPHFRYAIHDYSVALTLGREAIVFCARSVEWVKKYFQTRRVMKKSLCLSEKHLRLFLELANSTVIARHAGDPNEIRLPKLQEIEFSLVFTREMVLDRFGMYLWYKLSKEEPKQLEYPEDWKPPSEIFRATNSSLTKELQTILSRNCLESGLWYVQGGENVMGSST